MHPLLKEASNEAMGRYENISEINLDWKKLRLSSLPSNMKDADFLRVLKKSTRSISSRQLLNVFKESVRKFKKSIGDKKWFVVIKDPYDQDTNYSMFNFLLALNLFPDISETLQGILSMSKTFQFPASYSEYTYVSFELMSLSHEHLLNSMNNVRHMPRILVTSFVGESNLKEMTDSGIDVIYGDKLKQFVKYDPSRLNDTLEHKYEAYPVIIPHRELDEVVSFPEVYTKILTTPLKNPFGEGSYTRYSYLVNDVFNKFVTII